MFPNTGQQMILEVGALRYNHPKNIIAAHYSTEENDNLLGTLRIFGSELNNFKLGWLVRNWQQILPRFDIWLNLVYFSYWSNITSFYCLTFTLFYEYLYVIFTESHPEKMSFPILVIQQKNGHICADFHSFHIRSFT